MGGSNSIEFLYAIYQLKIDYYNEDVLCTLKVNTKKTPMEGSKKENENRIKAWEKKINESEKKIARQERWNKEATRQRTIASGNSKPFSIKNYFNNMKISRSIPRLWFSPRSLIVFT